MLNHTLSQPSACKSAIDMRCEEITYIALAQRYKELFAGSGGSTGGADIPFEIATHLTQIDTGKIDVNYMNSRFDKYLKLLGQPGISEDELQQVLNELHKSFAYLPQEDQKFANIFLHDVQRGEANLSAGMTLRDCITLYSVRAKDVEIANLVDAFGIDESKLRALLQSEVTAANINQYGRFDDLKNSVDKSKAKAFFETLEKASVPSIKVAAKTSEYLQRFILKDQSE